MAKCLQCGTQYQDEDDYFCPLCLVERKKLAAEIDAKIASRPKKQVVSDLQRYNSLPKVRGFVNAKDFL